jgi:hypothetical protein
LISGAGEVIGRGVRVTRRAAPSRSIPDQVVVAGPAVRGRQDVGRLAVEEFGESEIAVGADRDLIGPASGCDASEGLGDGAGGGEPAEPAELGPNPHPGSDNRIILMKDILLSE